MEYKKIKDCCNNIIRLMDRLQNLKDKSKYSDLCIDLDLNKNELDYLIISR